MEKLRYAALAIFIAIILYNYQNLVRLRIMVDAWVLNGSN